MYMTVTFFILLFFKQYCLKSQMALIYKLMKNVTLPPTPRKVNGFQPMYPLPNYKNIFNLCYMIILISHVSGPRLCPYHRNSGQDLSFLHSNSYFLTGVMSLKNIHNIYTVYGFTDIKYHVQWIREILNKRVRKYIYLLVPINFNF